MGVLACTKKLILLITVSVAARCILKGAENLASGKDILGKGYVERKKAFKTWNGNIILGRNDYKVA